MTERARRRQVLLSTTMLVGALTGYAGRAYADPNCVPAGTPSGPVVTCSGGPFGAPEIIDNTADTDQSLAVTVTSPHFQVNTNTTGNALTITGRGEVSFTDTNSESYLDASGYAGSRGLSITSTGDTTGTPVVPGSVTVNTSGAITGTARGMDAINNGAGALTVTANGDVIGTGGGSTGIYAQNNSGTDLSVTTGAIVGGGNYGIRAHNLGTGELTIDAGGTVTATSNNVNSAGIRAFDFNGGDVSVTTGAATVSGGSFGIFAQNNGTGELTIDAGGTVMGNSKGIYGRNNGGGSDITVTTAAGTTVSGGSRGIEVKNLGTGAVTVTANGNATGTGASSIGIRAEAYGTDLSVTTAAGTTASGSSYGIFSRNQGTGTLTIEANGEASGGRFGILAQNFSGGAIDITANGNVQGTSYDGISAQNLAAGGATDVTVTTGAETTVRAGRYGIRARNYGTGELTIDASGNVTGTGANSWGIYARNAGTDLTVTTGAVTADGETTTVSGANYGINARNYGTGALTITANGNVSVGNVNGYAIQARNYNGTDLSVTTAADTMVSGGSFGIEARNYGSGTLTVDAYGDITSDSGIDVTNGANATDLSITTHTGTVISSDINGIAAVNEGTGTLTIDVSGNVTATNNDAIRASNSGTDLSLTTAAGTTVSGGFYGIRVRNFGTGTMTVNTGGEVEGTDLLSFGIYARNDGSDLSVTTSDAVSGDRYGIQAHNNGTGTLEINTNGNVDATDRIGIDARNSGTDLSVTTAADTTVYGGRFGIQARNYGSGFLSVTANSDVEGDEDDGIFAQNGTVLDPTGTDLSVTTGTDTTVSGYRNGIKALNYGSGALTVTANGDVASERFNSYAIFARNYNGTDITVTTAAGTDITGGTDGIQARNYGSGAVTVEANGNVSALNAIDAQNSYGTDITVTTAADTTISGEFSGINAFNSGTGTLTVETNGNVFATNNNAITARSHGTDVSVTTAAGTIVSGGFYGITASNFGTGSLTIDAQSSVSGTDNFSYGIYAENRNGTDVSVTTGDAAVSGGLYGIYAINAGSGVLTIDAHGDVTATITSGISARLESDGTDLTVTTAAGTIVSGGDYGIRARNEGTGMLTVTANSNVTGSDDDGLYARHANGGPIDIAVGAGSTVTSEGLDADDFAVETRDGAAELMVAGTLNGGAGGAVQFDQDQVLDDRLALETSAVINGMSYGGLGTDTLALQGTGEGAFDVGQLADFESGEKTGDSSWVLTGTNTQVTAFAVDEGLLVVNGAMENASFTVTGGTLGGSGTTGAVTAGDGGTIAPGESIGTMTVNGTFMLEPGAVYEVEANAAGEADQVIVAGTVILTGANLNVLAEDGDYAPSTEYVIIDNDGGDAVTGTFADIGTNLAFLTPFVTYDGADGNDVVLTLVRNDVMLTEVATTRNQTDVAAALDRFPTGNPLYLAVLGQSETGARQAFDALSGEAHATLSGVLIDQSRYVRDAVLGRLMQTAYTAPAAPEPPSLDASALKLGGGAAPPRNESGLAFWISGFGAWADFDSDGDAAGAQRDLGGFVTGADAGLGGTWRAGLATGFTSSQVSVDARRSSADVESYHLAAYAGGDLGPLALRAGGAWSWNDIDTDRAVVFPGFFERERASYDGDTGQVFGEVAYPVAMNSVAFEPFAGVAYVEASTDAFTERGGEAALTASSIDNDVTYSTLGFRIAGIMQTASAMLRPRVSVAWQHAFDGVTPDAALAFATTGIGFTVYGVPLAEDSLLLEAGLDVKLGPNAIAGISYSGQFADNLQDDAIKGRATWRF